MSFAKTSKNELARLEVDRSCCLRAELAAFIHMNGILTLATNNNINLKLTTENPATARRIFSLVKSIFDIEPQILVQRKIRLQKNNTYYLRIISSELLNVVLSELGIVDDKFLIREGIKKEIIQYKCCRRAYLRGAFLATGSVANPDSTYHLELTSDYEGHIEALMKVMESFSLKPKMITRKNEFVAYLKDSEQIVNFLNVIGAHKALLDFENVRVMKGMRNQINRLVNCETANLQKTVVAALRHIKNIQVIDEQLGITYLPPILQDAAIKRVNYPEANLKELGELLEPPVGKSGVNHRLRRLERIAKRLTEGEEITDI